MKCFINHIFNLLEYLNFKERKRLLLFNEFHFFVFFFPITNLVLIEFGNS